MDIGSMKGISPAGPEVPPPETEIRIYIHFSAFDCIILKG